MSVGSFEFPYGRCPARRSSGWSTGSRIPSGCCSSSTRSPARSARRSSRAASARARCRSSSRSAIARSARTSIRSSRPSAEQKRWMRLVREALDTLTLPDAVMGVTLRVESVTGNDGAQGDLFDRGFASAPMVEDAIIQLTDDQGDVVVEAGELGASAARAAHDVETRAPSTTTRHDDLPTNPPRDDRHAGAHAPTAADAEDGHRRHEAAARSRHARALPRRQRVARHRRSRGPGSRVGRTMERRRTRASISAACARTE